MIYGVTKSYTAYLISILLNLRLQLKIKKLLVEFKCLFLMLNHLKQSRFLHNGFLLQKFIN